MGLFNINGGFAKFMNRAIDVFILSILWLVFSLPLVTIGASTCAAYYVSLKMVDDEEGYIAKDFIKGFKTNFRQGTIVWAFTAPCIYVVYLMWQVVIKSDDINFIVIVGAILFTALVIACFLYTYPMIARYENSLPKIIRNSIGICIQYFKRTVIVIVLVAIEVVIISWNKWTLLVGLLIGPDFIIFTISAFAKRIFLDLEKIARENK